MQPPVARSDAEDPSDRIIVALDGLDAGSALAMAAALPGLRWVKVGLELFTASGPPVVKALRERGLRVFLDLKFHDIPATMAGSCRSAAALGAELITVHASAGGEALRAGAEGAIQGAEDAGVDPPTLLAVTVLTSWSAERFSAELAISEPLASHVRRLAALAAASGLGGCVCSPHEAARLRRSWPEPFQLVTPGIRPRGSGQRSGQGSGQDDQARVMGPAAAIAAGATRLVIGRPILAAADPAAAFRACCQELADAHQAAASPDAATTAP